MKQVVFRPIDDALIEQVRDRIVETCKPEAVYLFGSAARRETHAHSDLDLLIVMDLPEGITTWEKASELYGLMADLNVPKDLIVQTPAQFEWGLRIPGSISRIVRKEGTLLYKSEDDGSGSA